MMAHAGATRATLGTEPASSSLAPSSRAIRASVAHKPSADDAPAPPDEAAVLHNCCLVFTTSNGVVANAAEPPASAPATRAANGFCTEVPSNQPRRKMASLMRSTPNQYSALNGTSRQSVLLRPRNRPRGPCSRTISANIARTPGLRTTCARAMPFSTPSYASRPACALVRTTSKGATAVAATHLEPPPAISAAHEGTGPEGSANVCNLSRSTS
mmetsp:Transcript_13122/g.37753  ORF Transcript_13122/g.37753 Transcript_13122/m.37753 type:complete len:214 (+) Transcript_13122:130-771(+)